MKQIKIAVLGYGTVGRALVELLDQHDLGIEVKYILRRPGKATGTDTRMTDTVETILHDSELDAVVDVLAGPEPAFSYMRSALEAGLSVVSANKAALARDLKGLTELARNRGAHLLYEASCGGGMPIIESIKKAVRFDRIDAMQGILNGTCNFILDMMGSEGLSFEAALKEAQRLGYAEADPTTDITGEDVRNKAIIACSLAFQGEVARDFPVMGLVGMPADLMPRLQKEGKALRLMMLARAQEGRYAIGVVPVIISDTAIPATVKKNFNYAELSCSSLGQLSLIAQGAGGVPTADAIIQDLLNLVADSATERRLDGSLVYDPSLLTGTVYLGDGLTSGVSLHDAVKFARENNQFLAFEPD